MDLMEAILSAIATLTKERKTDLHNRFINESLTSDERSEVKVYVSQYVPKDQEEARVVSVILTRL